jgi:hypothetical protein
MGPARSDAVKYLVLALALMACGDEKFTVEKLQDPETCKECHPKHFEQWSGSMHAYAADDPVFIAMNKRGQRETNGQLGDFCLRCHAPMAIQLGIADAANFDPAALPNAARGVTCYFCHNVAKVEADHNNGLVLAMDQEMRGGAKNPVDSPAHFSKYDPLMASTTNNSTMCGSCHDVVTPAAIHIERTYQEWQTTVFAIQEPESFLPVTCSKCHMTPSKGVIADNPNLDVKARDDGFHDHMMPAIDQALISTFPQIAEQRAAIDTILKPSLGIVGARPLGSLAAPGGICLNPPGELRVRVDSLSVGHHFPSGAAQDRRVWVEVIAYDASNNIVFQRGQVPAGTDPEHTTDTSLTCPNGVADSSCAGFWDRTYKADNSQAHFFWDVARVDSKLVRPAITRDPNSPDYDHSSTVTYNVGAAFTNIDRIEAKVWVRPLPFGALDELIMSGDLDPSVRDQLAKPEATMLATTSTWLKSTKGTGPAINTNCNPF